MTNFLFCGKKRNRLKKTQSDTIRNIVFRKGYNNMLSILVSRVPEDENLE